MKNKTTAMKTNKTKTITAMLAACLMLASCVKKAKDPAPKEPDPAPNEEEVITTFLLSLKDSATNATSVYLFKDPDGDGGQAPFYGPGTTSSSSQTDSVLTLTAGKTYFGEITLLDETKNPAVNISNEVQQEGKDHMLFYNNANNSIINSGNPYTVKLNGSGIVISYTDLDEGTTKRGIGLKTRWRTPASAVTAKNKLNITLKHQADKKDGTFAPGETDISVDFKIIVN